MNLKTPYEHLITQKLDNELPIPDMADAIWERIATQLDADMPAEPQRDSAPAPKSLVAMLSPYKWWALAIGGIVTLVVLLMLLTKPFKKKPRSKPPTPKEQQVPIIPDTSAPDTTATLVSAGRMVTRASADDSTSGGTTAIPTVVLRDSIQTVALPALTTQPDNLQLAPMAAGGDSTRKELFPSAKKPRGVPNISDKDYRISSKKDSL